MISHGIIARVRIPHPTPTMDASRFHTNVSPGTLSDLPKFALLTIVTSIIISPQLKLDIQRRKKAIILYVYNYTYLYVQQCHQIT